MNIYLHYLFTIALIPRCPHPAHTHTHTHTEGVQQEARSSAHLSVCGLKLLMYEALSY